MRPVAKFGPPAFKRKRPPEEEAEVRRRRAQSQRDNVAIADMTNTMMRGASHDAPSVAGQLPSIYIGFDDLYSRMNQFSARFDDLSRREGCACLRSATSFAIALYDGISGIVADTCFV
ncbi:hypothetical protein BCR34DRAFT_597803 [Clohesyomyces aquaticus]|uniref:Uncharacterized protein n=1 Tax=Clohesyomyces aquaticus TaxID=1231657 RepID=A0A1Y2A1B1_9PLEO|nr:hypothetical protein BCR34DRAFT_597803 [Clohesyomyces aquaticus]